MEPPAGSPLLRQDKVMTSIEEWNLKEEVVKRTEGGGRGGFWEKKCELAEPITN
jgi:hypothetical protein